MKRGILLLTALWLFGLTGLNKSFAQGQGQFCRFDRAVRMSGLGDEAITAVAADRFANLYVTGRFEGQLIIGGTTLTSAGEADIFLAKYDPVGNPVWAIRMGGRENDAGLGLVSDEFGNLFLTGTFADRATFGTFTLVSRGLNDIFLAKFNANGTAQFAKRAGSNLDDAGLGIALDRSGSILLTGTVSGESNFTGSQLVLPGRGETDIVVAKYSPAGNILWAHLNGSAGTDESGNAIAADAAGTVYVTGSFTGAAAFGTRTLTSAGGKDIFLAKYDPSGNLQTLEAAGGAGNDEGNGITVTSAGNIALTGEVSGNALFGTRPVTSAGGTDIFLAIYNNSGQPNFVSLYGSFADDAGFAIAKDADNKLYVTGSFSGPPAFGTQNLLHQGGDDVFIARFSEAGVSDWVYGAGGPADDISLSVTSTADGQVFIGGFFGGTAAFDNLTLTASSGQADPFHAKICNFTPRFCDMTINAEVKNETHVRNDGQIIVKSVTGVPKPFGYSLDKITYQRDSVFSNLVAGDYTLYVQNASGCSDSVKLKVEDECTRLFNAKFTFTDTAFCVQNSPFDLKITADQPFDLLGFSGSTGVVNGRFVPASAPIGQSQIIAQLRFPSTQCTVQVVKRVAVNPTLTGRISGLDSFYCWSESRRDMLTGFPAGGVFTGPGIENNRFKPGGTGGAGTGTHTIFYTSSLGQCTYVTSKDVIVGGEGNAQLIGLANEYCIDADPVQIVPSPPGGTLIGKGLGGDAVNGYFYYPSSLGAGTHQLTYFGQATDGCPFQINRFITVNEKTVPAMKPYPAKICRSATAPVKLEATPPGGTFAGVGITNGTAGTFDPFLAGTGVKTLFYTGVEKGCTFVLTFPIEVTPEPRATIVGLPGAAVCQKDTNYILRGIPSGGTFLVNADAISVFNPLIVGPGLHTVTYLADSNGCRYERSEIVEVTEIASAIKGLEAFYCETDAPVKLTGSPYGGTFSGAGVTGDFFNPQAVGAGTFLVNYTGDSAGCSYAVSVPVTIFSQPQPFVFGYQSTYCLNSSVTVILTGQPAGGTFSGPGMSPGGVFTPAAVGTVGPVEIVYSGTNGSCEYIFRDTIMIEDRIPAEIFNLQPDYCLSDDTEYTLITDPPLSVDNVMTINGIETNRFRPIDLPTGAVFVTFAGTTPEGCQFYESTSFIVGVPVQELAKITNVREFYCMEDTTPVRLEAYPPGGQFFGVGVVNNVFYPRLVETPGQTAIVYSGKYRGCDYFVTAVTEVSDACCPVPITGAVRPVSSSSVRLNWLSAQVRIGNTLLAAKEYDFRYREIGATDWINFPGIKNTFMFLNKLERCTGYEYQVRSHCTNGFYSEYSDPVRFTALAESCSAPEDLEALEVGRTTARLTWSPLGSSCPAVAQLQYREEDSLEWKIVNVADVEVFLKNLSPNTTYFARVRLRCDSLTFSPFSDVITFTTTDNGNFDCDIPSDFEVISVEGSEAKVDWLPVGGYAYYELSYRTLTDLTWVTVDLNNSEFSIIALQSGENYEVRVRTFCVNGGVSDFSDTLTFTAPVITDPCPEPTGFFPANISATEATLSWDFLPEVTDYELEVRLPGEPIWNSIPVPAANNFTLQSLNPFNSYEVRVRSVCDGNRFSDYSPVITIPVRDVCDVPDQLILTDYTSETFTAEWVGSANALSYEVQYRPLGSANWTSEFTPNTFIIVENLNPYLRYEIRVRTQCNLARSGFANADTLPVRELCPTPTQVFIDTPDPTVADVSWFGSSQAIEYEICLKIKGSGNCLQTQIAPAGANFATFTGLTSGTNYRVEIRAKCNIDVSSLAAAEFVATRLGETSKDISGTEVYPNPTKGGSFTVRMVNAGSETVKLTLTDLTGKTLYVSTARVSAGQNEIPVQADLSSGVYLLKVQTGMGSQTLKLTVTE